ncbi:hypothetical protein VC83_08587 [Pseudogymnoascus destructans]|nr:uncharacterized protein VC83_08587 [Pseudogymnoascus destructans]OAF54923.1 hypothetical protein VC83_08587 [Pseudogymnoascus destructans]
MMMRTKRETQMSIKFKDAVGHKFTFPFHIICKWAGMEDINNQAFLHVDVLGPPVQEGHYDLIGPNVEIFLPQVWESVIEPDMSITMAMWPMPEPPKNSSNDDDDDDDDQSSRSASPTLVDPDGLSPSESKKGRHWRIFKRWPNSASKEK